MGGGYAAAQGERQGTGGDCDVTCDRPQARAEAPTRWELGALDADGAVERHDHVRSAHDDGEDACVWRHRWCGLSAHDRVAAALLFACDHRIYRSFGCVRFPSPLGGEGLGERGGV